MAMYLNDLFGLGGEVALVTGATRGLGKAIALALSKAGADVAVAARNKQLLEKTASEIAALGRRSLPIVVDISDTESIRGMVENAIKGFGKIDILVCNAGVLISKRMTDLTLKDWDTTIKTNLTSAFYCAQLVGRHMIDRKKGKIIFISSAQGKMGVNGSCAYGPSKAGLIQLVKGLAVEWSRFGVNVNAIAPGGFETDMMSPIINDPKANERALQMIPMRRYGKPEELAGLVILLASKASDYITGTTIIIDGGWSNSKL
ncbi:MAG: SDR family oxidoreductase [Thermodesulfobacteriota bacterium]|jgi:NAD(P)-dependent dehydrogenase (short-subunit alcohol dehydrogenase family)